MRLAVRLLFPLLIVLMAYNPAYAQVGNPGPTHAVAKSGTPLATLSFTSAAGNGGRYVYGVLGEYRINLGDAVFIDMVSTTNNCCAQVYTYYTDIAASCTTAYQDTTSAGTRSLYAGMMLIGPKGSLFSKLCIVGRVWESNANITVRVYQHSTYGGGALFETYSFIPFKNISIDPALTNQYPKLGYSFETSQKQFKYYNPVMYQFDSYSNYDISFLEIVVCSGTENAFSACTALSYASANGGTYTNPGTNTKYFMYAKPTYPDTYFARTSNVPVPTATPSPTATTPASPTATTAGTATPVPCETYNISGATQGFVAKDETIYMVSGTPSIKIGTTTRSIPGLPEYIVIATAGYYEFSGSGTVAICPPAWRITPSTTPTLASLRTPTPGTPTVTPSPSRTPTATRTPRPGTPTITPQPSPMPGCMRYILDFATPRQYQIEAGTWIYVMGGNLTVDTTSTGTRILDLYDGEGTYFPGDTATYTVVANPSQTIVPPYVGTTPKASFFICPNGQPVPSTPDATSAADYLAGTQVALLETIAAADQAGTSAEQTAVAVQRTADAGNVGGHATTAALLSTMIAGNGQAATGTPGTATPAGYTAGTAIATALAGSYAGIGAAGTGASDAFTTNDGHTFIAWQEYTFGCAFNINMPNTKEDGLQTPNVQLCIRYRHITSLNVGPTAVVPTWPFTGALILVVIGYLVRR